MTQSTVWGPVPGGSTGRAEAEFLQLQHFSIPSCPAREPGVCAISVLCKHWHRLLPPARPCLKPGAVPLREQHSTPAAAGGQGSAPGVCVQPGTSGAVLGPAVIWSAGGSFILIIYFIFKGDSCLGWALAVWMQAPCRFLSSAACLVLMSLFKCHFTVTALSRNGHFLFEMTFECGVHQTCRLFPFWQSPLVLVQRVLCPEARDTTFVLVEFH